MQGFSIASKYSGRESHRVFQQLPRSSLTIHHKAEKKPGIVNTQALKYLFCWGSRMVKWFAGIFTHFRLPQISEMHTEIEKRGQRNLFFLQKGDYSRLAVVQNVIWDENVFVVHRLAIKQATAFKLFTSAWKYFLIFKSHALKKV